MATPQDSPPEALPPPVPQSPVSQDGTAGAARQNPSTRTESGLVDDDSSSHDVIIYLSSIHDNWTDQSLNGLALQIVAAFERVIPKGRFRSERSADGRSYSIFMRQSAHDRSEQITLDRPIVDLHAVDYRKTIIDEFQSRRLFSKCCFFSLPPLAARLASLPACSATPGPERPAVRRSSSSFPLCWYR
jgi:hypothetical protein